MFTFIPHKLLQVHFHFLHNFLLFASAFIAISCPYSSYGDALISEKKPIQISEYTIPKIDYSVQDSIGFGFWSQSIPQWSPQIIPYYGDQDFKDGIGENGNQLLLIIGDKELKVVCHMYLDWNLMKVIHQFEIYTNTLELQYQSQFQPINYEGVWIFTFISFQISVQTIKIESTGQEIISIPILIKEEKLKFILGGRTFQVFQVEYEEGFYDKIIINLNYFKGRISKLFISDPFNNDSQKFEEYSSLCKIPSKYNDQQTINLIDGLKVFDGNTELKFFFEQAGNKFCLFGWFKYDLKNVVNNEFIPILRISTQKNYGFSWLDGDEIFSLKIFLFRLSSRTNTQLEIFCDTHIMPQQGRINQQVGTILQTVNYYGIEILSNWHFLEYEYTNKSYSGNSIVQILFNDGKGIQKHVFPGQQLTNSLFYINIGSDQYFTNLLKGSIFGLNFQFNYQDDTSFDQLLTCHYTCYDCDGPLENDCIVCGQNSNRKFRQELKKCECQIGYFDVGISTCAGFSSYFSRVIQNEMEETSENLKCQFNYFFFPLKNNTYKCIQCPEIVQNQYYCVDCLLNQKTWYLKPICSIDIISQQNQIGEAYQILNRQPINYNVYFIDETGSVALHSEYGNICDSSNSQNCFLSKQYHIGVQIFVTCKTNYFYNNGECVFLGANCLQVNQEGKCEQYVDGVYKIQDSFYGCPFPCLNCVYNINIQDVVCLKCSEKYTLVNGKCYQCGQFCQLCQYYDESIENSYLKCYKCIDDSKYFISFDAINCQQNPIKFCLYAFQSDINDITKNTLDLYFFQRLDAENIVTHCARCSQDDHYYLLKQRICFQGNTANCEFGYAQQQCNIPVTNIFKLQCEYYDYYSPDGINKYQIGNLDDTLFCTTYQNCLIFESQYLEETIEFYYECPIYIKNCQRCLLGNTNGLFLNNPYNCLICDSGYYSERLSGKCYPCPTDLNCFSCFQQQILSQDYWKIYIRAFYKKFIDSDNMHSFVQYGQSLNFDEYEIKCDTCIDGYELYEKNCIKSCPPTCLECRISEGRPLSIYNNQCIKCPSNCALCITRSKEEIYEINPLFNNLNLAYHSNLCIQSYPDRKYYYDTNFNSFIQCEKIENCSQTFYIELTLFCSKSEFDTEYKKNIDKKDQQIFLQKNIFIDDLVSGNSFLQYENNDFYQIANQKQIRSIIIKIYSTTGQTCTINQDGLIQQQFSQNIFSAINIQISLLSLVQTSTIIFQNSLIFRDFRQINISGFIIKPQQNDNFKQIIFNSTFSQLINLNSIIFSQLNFIPDYSQIIFNSVSQLILSNFQIKNLFLQNVNPFVLVNQTSAKKFLTLQNFSILKSSLFNVTLFQVSSTYDDNIVIENMIIKSKFINSNFFITKSENTLGNAILSQINIETQIVNSVIFNLIKLYEVVFDFFYIQSCQIQNSTLCLINNNAKFNDLNVIGCIFQQNSFGISNSKSISQTDISYSLQKLLISDNQYSQDTNFLKFIRQCTNNSFIEIKEFKILNNFNNLISKDFNIKSITSTLLYLELNQIVIDQLIISRGVGLPEITIVDAMEIEFTNSKILQSEQFKFFGLHQYIDCTLQQLNGLQYPQSLRIYGSKYLFIDQLQILSVQTINFPVVLYNSINVIYKEQTEIVILQNVLVQDCLIILTHTETDLSIIKFYSEQETKLQFNNLKFEANILHEYVQNLLSPSALLVKIDIILGVIQISNSQFIQNTVLNSTDSIAYINANQITITDCKFDSNSQFNYTIIQPYLLWGFSYSNIPFYEDLLNIFGVKSFTGNGLLIAQSFDLINCVISNSFGSSGGGFMLQAKKSCNIKVVNLICSSVYNTFNDEIETGGCFHIDSISVQTLQLSLEDIFVSHVHSRFQGGFIFLDTGNNVINVNIVNITIIDVYSQYGSILYVKSSGYLNQQLTIKVKQIVSKFSNNGIISYLDRYYLPQISETEQIRLINNMTLFYFENSRQIVLEEIFIQTLLFQALVKVENVQKFILLNFETINSSISNNLITLNSKSANNIFIVLNNIRIKYTQVGVRFLNLTYNIPQKNLSFQTFKCLTQGQIKNSPKQLFKKNFNNNSNYGQYLLMKIYEYLDQGNQNIISLISLGYEAQVKVDNIQFLFIFCRSCKNGFLHYEFLTNDKIREQYLSNIQIQNSNCGNFGCINLNKLQSTTRLLESQEKYLSLTNFEIILKKVYCNSNFANFGTCLYINNLKVLVDNSIFYNNKADNNGGAIYFLSKQILIISSCEIVNNTATIGGGIFFENSNEINYLKLGTIFQNNQASFYGNDVSSIPQKLTIAFGESNNYFQTISTFTNQSSIQDLVIIYMGSQEVASIMLPSGQSISEHNFFNWKKSQYIPFNKKLRLIALNRYNEVMKNLSNSYCDIKSRYLNLSQNQSEEQFQFTNNFTNIKQINFDSTTHDYNLDNLIIYFDNETPEEIVLQLQFNCSSIIVPIQSQKIPYNIIGQHHNYKLNLNVKSYKCQYGEIKNLTNYSCQICDGLQGQFQLKLNQEKCEIKDDVSTISVQSAQLNLRQGYWRPYFDSSIVTYCLNLPLNCLGSWNEGDLSCVQGHIGALCEQCDLYNIRGHGRFSVSYKYSCGSCFENNRNAVIISFVSLWTFISIILSVYSTLKVFEQRIKFINIKQIGLIVNSDINQSGILIKILTNYFQIITSLSSFQLSFSVEINTAINTFGSPIQTMIYSLDCFLINVFQFQIHYARMVWQLIMPIIYINIFFLIYFIGIRTRMLIFNQSVISTTLIYMYIYLQPSLIGGFVELLSFRDISGYKWILANVSYLYDSSMHFEWMVKFCFPTFLLLALLIPFFLFYGLYSSSTNLNDKFCRLKWGYLYNEYKPQAYFWDIIKIVKKELMIIFLTYYTENVNMKAMILVFILLVYLDFNLKYRPYFSINLNQLDFFATTVCIKSMILASATYIAKTYDINEVRIISLVLLFSINIMFIIQMVLKIIQEYMKKQSWFFNSQLDKVSALLSKKFPWLQNYPFLKKFLKNREQQKQRVKQLFQILKSYLISQAREIIILKRFSEKCQRDNLREDFPSTMRNQVGFEKQSLIIKSIRENSNQTKYSLQSQMCQNIILNSNIQSPKQIDEKQVKFEKVKSIYSKVRLIEDKKNLENDN